ncbi:14200_t:CDS:2 [Funneliformis geosporum]|nr:14200_t:CDS:2 [Funneliformis geosporum]
MLQNVKELLERLDELHIPLKRKGKLLIIQNNMTDRAKISDAYGLVKRSWEKISDEIIIESFTKYYIIYSLVNSDVDGKESEIETDRSEVDEECN